MNWTLRQEISLLIFLQIFSFQDKYLELLKMAFSKGNPGYKLASKDQHLLFFNTKEALRFYKAEVQP